MKESSSFEMFSRFEVWRGVGGYVRRESGGRERRNLGEFCEEEEGVDVGWLRTSEGSEGSSTMEEWEGLSWVLREG